MNRGIDIVRIETGLGILGAHVVADAVQPIELGLLTRLQGGDQIRVTGRLAPEARGPHVVMAGEEFLDRLNDLL